jgi:hypothetical protein
MLAVGSPACGQRTTSPPMKIEVNIDTKDTPIVAFIVKLLERGESWTEDGRHSMHGPHGIYIDWDNSIFTYLYLSVGGAKVAGLGFLDKWMIIRAANKTMKSIKRVQRLIQEEKVKEILADLIAKEEEAKS